MGVTKDKLLKMERLELENKELEKEIIITKEENLSLITENKSLIKECFEAKGELNAYRFLIEKNVGGGLKY